MDAPEAGWLRIDIVSDVVCPWCVLGWRQLERALRASAIEAAVHWHPFELNPHMAAEGEDLREHLAAKYGTTAEASRANRDRLRALGAELGFTFAFADDMRIRNTFNAHQLVHWAGLQGKAQAAEQALFAAYFSRGQDVHDIDVLAGIAGELGLDPTQARAVLTEQRYAAAVRDAERQWTSRDVHAVPAMIFAGRYLVSGAQGVESYTSILRQLAPAAVA